MSRRQLAWILGLVVLLGLAWVVSRLTGPGGEPSGRLALAGRVPLDAERILVSGPEPADTTLLVRAGDGWTVNGWPADTGRIRRALTALDSAPPTPVVSRNPANYDRLGVSPDSATRVAIGPAGDPALVLWIGKAGPTGRYVRIGDADRVYSLPSSAARPFDGGAAPWRDLRVARVDTAAVDRIVVERGETRSVLVRVPGDTASAWRLGGPDGPNADPAGDGILGSVAELDAAGVPPDSIVFRADFDRPDARLDLYAGADTSQPPALSLLLARVGNAWLVRRADRALVYRLDAWTASRLAPPREALPRAD